MQYLVPIIFLILLAIFLPLAVMRHVKNLRRALGTIKREVNQAINPPMELTRSRPGTPEWAARAINMQMVNLSRPAELMQNGHLKNTPQAKDAFNGKPCWLRYEQDGFWLDYANNVPSWKVTPLPPEPTLGMCDGNAMVQIHHADGGFWAYDGFGQKKYHETSPVNTERMFPDAPGDREIDMSDAGHVAWVKAKPHPALWHLPTMAAMAYVGDPHDFVLWLVDQPDLQRSTAGWIFLWSDGLTYLAGQELYGEGMSGEQLEAVLDALCKRSESRGFREDTLPIEKDFETQRQQTLNALASKRITPLKTVPYAILNTPFLTGPIKAPFSLDDGIITI